jgi:excisionase family DNA binding protein
MRNIGGAHRTMWVCHLARTIMKVNNEISDTDRRHRPRPRAMSIEEFCDLYGPGRTKAYEEIKSGRLRARKIGKRTIITLDDAEDWLRRLPEIQSGVAS